MEFRILGPLEAEIGGQLLPLRGRRQRALLALLLLSANEVVPDDRLLEDLWAAVASMGRQRDRGVRRRSLRARSSVCGTGFELLDRVSDPDHRADIHSAPISGCVWSGRFNEARRLAAAHDEITRPLTPHHHAVGRLLETPLPVRGWYRGWMALATIITRLDGLAAVGDRSGAEQEAGSNLRPNTYLEPFALRALGLVREEPELLERAQASFEALGLEWHAEQTRALL